ncbi:MAG TPA: hypothetical protein VFF30_13205 [Nitrososphaerales archaeon]|nr:hypothetical protein [Nitrososphaerales archaeon]
MTQEETGRNLVLHRQDGFRRNFPKLSLVVGMCLLTVMNLFYAANRSEFVVSGSSPLYSFGTLTLLLSGAFFLGLAGLSYLWFGGRQSNTRMQRRDASGKVNLSINKITADAFFKNGRILVLVAVLYAVFFALVDAIIIYQPTVDFFTIYNVSGVTFRVLTCCGGPADIPVFLFYFPSQHLGLQLVPLSVLLMILVSSLVGLNISLLYMATRLSRGTSAGIAPRSGAGVKRTKGGSFSSVVGAAFGLFSGCPTCAAAFFLSMVAGSGATAVSSLLSEYQPAIVALTIPLLLGSIYWQAKSVRILMQGCSV